MKKKPLRKGKRVKIVKICDGDYPKSWIGRIGTYVGSEENYMGGPKEFNVDLGDDVYGFWRDELEVL